MPIPATVPDLLAQVSTLAAQHRARRQATGEDFNIFRILGLRTAEVRTHSAFLAEMLNPAGSHGMDATFLALLLQQLKIEIADFDPTAGVRVKVEDHIGFLNEDSSTGGRIDICLYPASGAPIFIENKIHAGDQKNQLLRYHNHVDKPHIWYLTLNGDEPDEYATGSQPFSIRCLSYKTDIINWLEVCRKEVVSQPLIRETLTQYIHLLKELTGQSADQLLMEELKKLLLNDPANLESVKLLTQARSELLDKIGTEVKEALDTRLGEVQRDLKIEGAPLGTILRLGAYIVYFAFGTDSSDGYYWGIRAKINDEDHEDQCRSAAFDGVSEVLGSADVGHFQRTNWWVGWINPPNYVSIDRCSSENVIELAHAEAQQALATETARQARECVRRIQERFDPKVG